MSPVVCVQSLVVLVLMLAVCGSTMGKPTDGVSVTDPINRGRTYPAQVTIAGGASPVIVGVVNQRERVFALLYTQSGGVLAAGARGLLLLQDRVSKEWRRLDVPGQPNLYSVVQDSHGRFWFGSDAGQLYIANPELTKWETSYVGQKDVIYALEELPDGRILAAGQYGLLALHSSSGDNWKEVVLPWSKWLEAAWAELGEASPHLFGICGSGQSTLVVGEFGLVVEFDGNTWSRRRGGSIEPSLYGCASDEGSDIVAVGQGGEIIYSSDQGASWLNATVNSPASMYQPVKIRDKWVAVGENGRLWWATQPRGPWACSRIGNSAAGWFVDVLGSETKPNIVVGGAGELRTQLISNIGAHDVSGVSCG